MALKRITEEEMNAQGVIAAPDILNGTPAQNKAIFDRMVRSLVAPAVNACAEAVDEVNANQEEWDKQEQTRETNEGNRETKEVRREEAEATRETNEAARKQAEGNRSLAEGQRVEAEAKRVGAESERRSEFTNMSGAETRRAEAETLRSQSEKNRESAESYRELAEASRVQAEAGRTSREQTRETNEEDRKTAEVQREEAESVREANETARKRAEVNRADAEAERVAAEQERVDTNNGIVAQATEAAKQAEQSAADAAYNAENAGKPPYIGENGNWFVWDMTTAAFVDSGEKAEGVTVSSVNESTEDGGSNVVTFSDGKKLTVKNGKQGGKGDPGYTPVRGKDYWTTNDENAIAADISVEVAEQLAGKAQLKPEFAESVAWLEENGDQRKMYVLPDGFIYAYMLTEVETGPSYTNVLPLAVNADGTPYVGNNGEDGYKTNYRLNSSKAEVAESGMCCTGFIPIITPTEWYGTLRFKNITVNGTKGGYIYAFGSDRSSGQGSSSTFSTALNNNYDANTGVYSLVIGNENNKPEGVTLDDSGFALINSASYLRISIGDINENTIITWNEEITESGGTTTGYAWVNTGRAFVPADYEDRIIAVEEATAEHTTKIAALEKAVETGGVDENEKAAYTRLKNWKYPIHEDAPVFLLETNKPAIPSTDWTTEAIYAKYDALMAANSHYITKVDCGMASDGTTPIYVYHFKEPEPHHNDNNWSETKPVILVCSGVHPTEQSGVWSMYYAMEEITNNKKLLDLRRNVHFIIMPMINPTGFTDSTYGVRNPDGIQVHYNFEVDFKYPTDSGYVAHGNRNHGGETPLSIPETQYFDALMNEYKNTLACVLSCHNNDVDTQWGAGFVWSSCATHFMCNLGFRLVDKLSAAWREKHGTAFDEGVRWANEYALAQMAAGSSVFTACKEQAEWDFRVGRASLSSSGGTEYKQALKYGVHGINVEVCDRCMVLDKDYTQKRTENVTTMGCETYVNFFRTFMEVYDPKDKKDYAPNLPWED